MQLHLDLPPRAASQDLRALWSHLYQLTERLNTTVFADRPDPQPVRPEAIPDTNEESAIPLDHAAAEPTYGAGTADAYGHVKLSDTASASLDAADGTAATPKAVAALQQTLNGLPDIQTGEASISFGSNTTRLQVKFPKAFAAKPTVIVSQVFDDANLVVLTSNISTTGFYVNVTGGFSSSGTRAFRWLAVGKLP